MRARRPQRKGPLPGFSLALPAASTRSELQVLQQDENDVKKFFIHADDTLISPIITTDPQFSSVKPNTMEPRASELGGTATAESGSAAASSAALPPPSKFIHVHNTNLFVLMDGVPMFLDNQSTFTGEEDIDVIQEKVRRRKAERLLTRAADVVGTDTVEEAIRDIEKDDAATHAPSQQQQQPFSQTSTKAVAAAPPSVTSSISALGNWNTFARTQTEGSLHFFNRQSQHSSTATAGGGPRRSSLPGAEATLTSKPSLGVPDNFAALFSNAKKPKTPAVFRQTRLSAQTSATNTSTPSSSTYTATPLATPPSALPVSSEPNASTSAGTAREGTLRGSSSNTTQQLRSANQPQQPNHTSSQAHRSNNSHRGGRGGRRQLTKSKIITADEIGHSNPSLDMDEVNVLHYIGDGSQGKVYCVMLESKYFALKRLDAKAATEATNSVERQGRKRGLVKELNMIRLQRSMVPPQYLMQMFNAVAKFDSEVQELNILMELMSFGVEDAQQMAARIPHNEMLKVSQANFRQYVVRKDAHNEEISRLMKQQYGPCTRVIGRRTFNIPEDWEMQHNRQTTIPEIVLSFLAADVLRGLQELHRDYHMVHCDLKPANVLLCFDKLSFKLADFGCSCVMDHNTQRVRRQGVDLGTKLYKAPERIANEGSNHVFEETAASLPVEALAAAQCVEFSGKSDVWSLGIMLLELASGVHPCTSFKSDFWNYQSQLRLSKMIKPVSWSAALCDFVVRCICVEERRWSVDQLLVHPFIKMYNHVPRAKLKSFMERLENDSADFQRRHQLKLLEEQIQLSTTNRPADLYQRDSRSSWRTFTAFLAVGPELKDMEKFPPLT